MRSKHNISHKMAFTIDVEDGVNIAMRDHFNVNISPTIRVKINTNRLLDLLDKYNVKATFFVLGQVASTYPDLIKKIHQRQHEVGVHGYDHIQIFKMNRNQMKADLKKAKDIIEDIIGEKTTGFRAPAFSILPKTAWALEIIAEMGFTYDSSIMPASTGRYGWPGFPNHIHKIKLNNNLSIIEVPMATVNILGREFPVAGGGYLRLLPYWFTSLVISRSIKKKPFIIYMHPYEIDVERYPEYFYSALAEASFKKKVQVKLIRYNKETVFQKIETILKNYSFDRLDKLIKECI